MAKSATKTLARTNTTTLNNTHLITVTLHSLFILYRLLYRHSSVKKYLLLSFPSLLIELYLEKLGRPKHNPDGTLKSAGEDMAAKGVTEYAWDIVYATWIVLGVVGVAGEWAWWLAIIVPGYAAFLAYTMYADMKRGIIPGMPAPTQQQQPGEEAQSKRSKKMEKRGGQQKTQYR